MGSSRLICSFIVVLIHLRESPRCSAASSIDVPLRGAAVQSSTYEGWSAGQAIDGSCSPDGKDSCTHTLAMDNPWWRLQLDGVYRVSVIEITNMYSTRKWLDGVEIHIGNSLVNNGNDNPRCAIIHDVPDGLTQTVHCWGMEGMYVNFYKPFNTTYLMLCEVKVYGELAPPPPSISTPGVGMNVTLVGKRLCWSDALFYCRDYHWDLLTLRGPAEQEMVDDLVARAPFTLTSHLWVGLRRSILGSSWFWMSGDPMDFTQWDEASQEPSPCGGISSTERSTWRQRFCGEHLNFICFTGPTGGKKVRFFSTTRVKPTCKN
ncbi:lymphocyte antigen 75 isoform X1 [Gadus morhua]|uniref:lymphocyte antigen 75 isoform X1 n=2 Tax=Gadus morhua TaxID=8049 RepID=UPI0011B7F8C9|nr:lymphocyte antigen 75-like isoform X1 [Gadus morhua]